MAGNGITQAPQLAAGQLARQDAFGGSELAVSAEVQAQALAAASEAEVKARWAIAQRNPRNWDAVRVALLRECERPGFADQARYSKPVGKDKVSGPSIRFVETALRCMTNIIASTTVVSEDARTRRLQVMVTDLEANLSWPRQITIEKTVERRQNKDRQVVGVRTNTYGETVFIVVATEDELANKEASAISKAIRQAGLRILPGDLVEEAMAKVDVVRNSKVKTDPNAERKRLVDAFVKLGVRPEDLEEYLGHDLGRCQPDEISELRDIHAALKEGESRWADIMEAKRELDPKKPTAAPPPPAAQQQPATAAAATTTVVEAPAPTTTPLELEVNTLRAFIDSAASGKDLAERVGPAINKASKEAQAALMAEYLAKKQALKAGGK